MHNYNKLKSERGELILSFPMRFFSKKLNAKRWLGEKIIEAL